MEQADFLATGYYGLQTGILGITALFTLVFAYIGGLHLFLRKEPLITRIATYIVFVAAFVFLHFFLYSASLFGQEWLEARRAVVAAEGGSMGGFYAGNSVIIMRVVGGIVALATLVFTTIVTFRKRKT